MPRKRWPLSYHRQGKRNPGPESGNLAIGEEESFPLGPHVRKVRGRNQGGIPPLSPPNDPTFHHLIRSGPKEKRKPRLGKDRLAHIKRGRGGGQDLFGKKRKGKTPPDQKTAALWRGGGGKREENPKGGGALKRGSKSLLAVRTTRRKKI